MLDLDPEGAFFLLFLCNDDVYDIYGDDDDNDGDNDNGDDDADLNTVGVCLFV